jgi:hypothetical protein
VSFVRSGLFGLAASSLAVASLLAVGACDDEGDNTARALDGGDAGVDVADARRERGPAEPEDAACPLAAPPSEAPIIEIEIVPGDAPSSVGGVIVPGKYFLTKSEVYLGSAPVAEGGTQPDAGPTGGTITRTVVITDENIAYSEGEGTPDGGITERDEHVLSYGGIGVKVSYQELCPTRGGTTEIGFSVIGNELHLFPSPKQREILTKQP